MEDELVEDFPLFGVEAGADRLLALVGHEPVVAPEDLLHLDHVVGAHLGGGVDGGEAAADHHRRQPDLQVGERPPLERAGELERHQEVGGGADAADEIVLDVDHRRASRAGGDGDVVESHLPGVLQRERSAETDAAVKADVGAAGEGHVEDGEEVLVPADGDAVLGHAAEAPQGALVELDGDLVERADRLLQELPGERLDLEPVDADDAEPLVGQVMGQGVTGRAQPDHEDILAVVGEGIGAADGERIPAGEQPIDLESPGERKHVGQHARLGLRDVHRLLLLEDARLHAVVADAVAGAGCHRVIDGDESEGTEGIAPFAEEMHLGDLLVEGAAGERDAQRVRLDPAVLVVKPFGAGVLVAVVAIEAVVDLARDLERGHAAIGEAEAVPGAAVLGRALQQVRRRAAELHQIFVDDGVGQTEGNPVAELRLPHHQPALEQLEHARDQLAVVRLGDGGGGRAEPGGGAGSGLFLFEVVLQVEEARGEGGDRELVVGIGHAGGGEQGAELRVELGVGRDGAALQGAPLDHQILHPEDRRGALRLGDEGPVLFLHAEQTGHERPYVGGGVDQDVGDRLGGHALAARGAVGGEAFGHGGMRGGQLPEEHCVELGQPFRQEQIVPGKP